MNLAAIETLEQLAPTSPAVVELGSGASTQWWIRRGATVTAFEDDPAWAAVTRAAVEAVGSTSGVTLVDGPDDLARVVDERIRDGHRCDVLVSDGLEPRVTTTRIALPLLRTEGLLVIDNSDRPELSTMVDRLLDEGWLGLRVFGLVPTHGVAHETAFLSRRPFSPQGRTRSRARPAR